jgi:Mor family transcriptional regulator
MNTKAARDDSLLLLRSEFAAIIREQVGMAEPMASQVAEAVVRGMRLRYGTQQIYIPAVDKAERDALVRKEFKGTNAGEVCKRHGISRPSLYRIVKAKPH